MEWSVTYFHLHFFVLFCLIYFDLISWLINWLIGFSIIFIIKNVIFIWVPYSLITKHPCSSFSSLSPSLVPLIAPSLSSVYANLTTLLGVRARPPLPQLDGISSTMLTKLMEIIKTDNVVLCLWVYCYLYYFWSCVSNVDLICFLFVLFIYSFIVLLFYLFVFIVFIVSFFVVSNASVLLSAIDDYQPLGENRNDVLEALWRDNVCPLIELMLFWI